MTDRTDAPQTGYSSSSYPGAQPAGYPGFQTFPGHQVQPKSNGLAVGALVAGIIGMTVIPLLSSIVAIILGHLSRAQIRRTGEGGAGLALAGLVIGYVGLLATVMGILLLMWLTSDNTQTWISNVLEESFGS